MDTHAWTRTCTRTKSRTSKRGGGTIPSRPSRGAVANGTPTSSLTPHTTCEHNTTLSRTLSRYPKKRRASHRCVSDFDVRRASSTGHRPWRHHGGPHSHKTSSVRPTDTKQTGQKKKERKDRTDHFNTCVQHPQQGVSSRLPDFLLEKPAVKLTRVKALKRLGLNEHTSSTREEIDTHCACTNSQLAQQHSDKEMKRKRERESPRP